VLLLLSDYDGDVDVHFQAGDHADGLADVHLDDHADYHDDVHLDEDVDVFADYHDDVHLDVLEDVHGCDHVGVHDCDRVDGVREHVLLPLASFHLQNYSS
jgi:hypothetical protein